MLNSFLKFEKVLEILKQGFSENTLGSNILQNFWLTTFWFVCFIVKQNIDFAMENFMMDMT